MRCDACAHEYLLAFSCKARYFCPSCHAKRLALWTLWLEESLLAPVPHRQVVLTIPKRLRTWCLYRRALLGDLARVAGRTVTAAVRTLTHEPGLAVGVVACIQTHGSLANWHPHLHMLVTDGGFRADGTFVPWPAHDTAALTEAFRRACCRDLRRRDANTTSTVGRPEADAWTFGELVHEVMGEVWGQCQVIGFQHTAALANHTTSEFASGCSSPTEIQVLLNTLDFSFATELEKEWFLKIEQDRQEYYEQKTLFGQPVDQAFPSARFDIREAGNCLATDSATAAVFHLMRAVEWALHAFCVHLGFTKLRTRNRKTGKVTYRLVEYSEWETILNQLQDRVDNKIAKIRRGAKKQSEQEFYYPALQDLRGIRDAWRNHTMHTRSE